MKVEDYYTEGRRAWFRLHEKGAKRHELPAHHNLPLRPSESMSHALERPTTQWRGMETLEGFKQLLDYRRRSVVDVGQSVIGQALEIGPDQGFVGRWQAPSLAAIELRG